MEYPIYTTSSFILFSTCFILGDDEIQDVAIPTGIPIVYKFNNIKDLKPISWPEEYLTQRHMKGVFLEKPGLLKEALKLEQEWSSRVPGYDSAMGKEKNPTSPLERSLNKLKAERELGQLAGQFKNHNVIEDDDGTDGNQGRPIQFEKKEELTKMARPEVVTRSKILDEDEDDESAKPTIISANPCQTPLPNTAGKSGNVPIRTDATIVIIRHGKTEHNKLGLFTGEEWTSGALFFVINLLTLTGHRLFQDGKMLHWRRMGPKKLAVRVNY
jgi:hypothetical protein